MYIGSWIHFWSLFFNTHIYPFLNISLCHMLLSVLSAGPIPRHVGFIMDGNRTFAKIHSMPPPDGHSLGAYALQRVLGYCTYMGISEITVYAFSIENFRRPDNEVQMIFTFLAEHLRFLAAGPIGAQARIRIIGNKSMIRPDILEQLIEIQASSDKPDKKTTVNICVAYTSRDEMTHAIRSLASQRVNGIVHGSIDTSLFQENMYFGKDTLPVDLLVRTSGHTRLSDFLLWQCNLGCVINFLKTLWPDFLFIDLYWLLLCWGYGSYYGKRRYFFTGKTVGSFRLPPSPPLASVSEHS